MKQYIVKRKKDGNFLVVSERELQQVLNRKSWDGMNFVEDFEFIGEEKNIEEEMEELFNEK